MKSKSAREKTNRHATGNTALDNELSSDVLLRVHDLQTYFFTDDGVVKAVDGVSFDLKNGETLGIIGESGCGKSVTAHSVLRIVPSPGRVVGGSVVINRPEAPPLDLAALHPSGELIRSIRGRHVSMIFQEPMTSLSPVHTIGNQIAEVLLQHRTDDKREATSLAIDMLRRVGMPKAEERITAYPHQLSGGLRQRAMIAMALSCQPSILIADEPTTALDVTIQAQILDLMRDLQSELGMSVLFITHDLGVIAEMSSRVVVMYLGKIVESADVETLFESPAHPYTRRLMKSIPTVGRKARVRLDVISGNVPTPLNLPVRCGFFGRCPEAIPGTCDRAIPELTEVGPGHMSRCFLHNTESEHEATDG